MKTTIKFALIVAAFACGVTFADDVDEVGGLVTKPGTMKGTVAVIDTQNIVCATNFMRVASVFSRDTSINFVYQRADAGDPAKLASTCGAKAAVIIVDDDTTPSMLLAPDDHWGVVNIRKLSRNLKTEKAMKRFYADRCEKQVMRALAALCGGISSQYPKNTMNVTRIEDLDFCQNDALPADQLQKFGRYLGELGVTPAVTLMYEDACYEGWAPAPTNDIQKAIWEKVKNRKIDAKDPTARWKRDFEKK